MMKWGDPRSMERCHQASVPALECTWKCEREEPLSNPDALARTACAWFFEQFGWHDEGGVLQAVQRRIFSDR